MKAFYCAVALVLLAGPAFAECDCLHFPIKPEGCVQACRTALLRSVPKADLEMKLNLPPAVAEGVVNARQNKQIFSLDDLKTTLSEQDVQGIKQSFDNLSTKDAAGLAKQYGFGATPSTGSESRSEVFDSSSPVDLTGKVTTIYRGRDVNQLYLAVPDPNGKMKTWTIELSPGAPRVKPGDRITVTGDAARSNSLAAAADTVVAAGKDSGAGIKEGSSRTR